MAIQRDKIVASAEKLVAKGRVEAAIKEYDRLLDDNPNDVNTLNRIGDLWVRISRTDEAVKVFTRIADHYSKDGFFLKAIAIFKKINKLDPSRLEIYARLADLYAKQGLAMEAKGQYQVLADYYTKHGQPENALKTFQRIAELDPNSINVHVKLADLYSQNGRTADALKEYDRVGRMLLKRGMTDEAVQVFRKALKIDPGNIELAESLANTLIEAKDFTNAQQILEGARESNSENPRIAALLGKVYIGKGDLRSAERTLTEAVAQHPGEPSVAELLADLFLRRGNAGAALNVFEPLVDGAAARGDRSAVEMLQKVVRVDAGHIPTLEKLVEVYQKLNEETNILSSMNSLAEAHISAGNHDSAAEVLETLIKREPENAQHKEKLAFVRGRGAPPAPATPRRPTPPPPASEPEEAELEFDSGPELELASEPDSLDLGFSPPPLPPPPSIREDSPAEIADQEGEDIDFVTEQLTEAEVFAKYGLTEKAVEHLQAVLDRSPKNLQAYDKLLHIHLDEGNAPAVATYGAKYLELLAERGETDTADSVRSELISRGYSPAGGLPQEQETPPAEPEIEVEEIGTELEIPEEPAEPEPEPVAAEPEAEIEFDLEPSLSIDQDESSVEIETEFPAAVDEDVATEQPAKDLEVELETAAEAEAETEVEIEAEEPAAAAEPPVEEEIAPAPGRPAEPAAEELGEVDFYMEQELFDEAEERIGALEERFPGNREVASRRELLERKREESRKAPEPETFQPATDLLSQIREEVEEEIAPPAAAANEENLFAEEDDFFDLAAELEQELADDSEGISISEEEQSLEEIFKEFKRGVEQQLDAEDYDTHYNLGIAYKEMELIDEAIGEFQLASKDPKRMIECCSMLGLCFLEKGMPQLAIKWYQKGLEAPEITDAEHLGLLYDLGSAYLEVGDTANAQKALFEVYGINSNYRDIVSRIKQVEDVTR
ncbi:MAG TPA: tetratricopeptide repeat protein [Thermoanaerobaculia bacterium]|nr:tetratricopeptide repeat protein [Thermoanaerobaculia bacterium]